MARSPLLLVLLAILALASAEPRDARGWRPRAAPPDPATLTTPPTPQALALPPAVSGRITRRTILIYLSPSCPHCLHALAEIASLSRRVSDVADTLCVMSGIASRGDVESFVAAHDLPFPVIHDADMAFAAATGLDATPSLLVVDPPVPGTTDALAREAWLPYLRGAGPVLEMRIRGDPEPVLRRGQPVGVLTCSACHAEEARAWSASAHGTATSAVVRKQRGDDLECLACHVTFLDRSSGPEAGVFGFRPDDRRSPFADVGCESCHTASGPHDGDGGDPRAACAGCHDAGHGRFDPVAGLAAIDHFGTRGVSDEVLRERRLELARGLGPRPFADLPVGPTVGVEVCAGCHRDPMRAWRRTPHARAVDASVGCEACHGPGGLHAADPSTPMVSLRSPDPECAVERVCTRCHTPERDPDWALRGALPLVRH